jgi:hydroxyacylglutathione hydrolase
VAIIIEPVACLKDNYAYLIHGGAGGEAVVVDPSEAPPVAAALAARGLVLRGILATHHHLDHTGGIEALVNAAGAPVWVAAHERDRGRIPRQTVFADAPEDRFVGTELSTAGARLLAMHIPGHTRAAIAWGVAGSDGAPTDIFTGDTLFGAGCGRLFEGTPADMLRSLRALTAGAETTRLWFGHEYTASNLKFAATVEAENAAVHARAEGLGSCTTPTTIGLDRRTNPFVRASSVEELASRRTAKDRF